MKIGILTFHEIYNPGAYLQAMGTFDLLKSMGHQPVVINYTTPAHRFSILQMLRRNWRLAMHPRYLVESNGRHRAFQKALRHFNLTDRFSTHEELEGESFDAVLIGADIVWDYIRPVLGQDPVYFGRHLNTPLKISFAASCGRVPVDNQPPEYVVEGLKEFSAISVRDANTQQMVQKYSERDAEIICDPAFHLDIEKHTEFPNEKQPYLLVYMLPGFVRADVVEQVKAYADKHKLKIIAVCYRQKWADENRISIGPQQWLGYIRNASAVVTNTFHGTIFSVKAGVPFVSELNDAIRLKTLTMIDRLQIMDRFLTKDGSVDKILDRPWDVDAVHQRIESWRGEAELFLKRVLG